MHGRENAHRGNVLIFGKRFLVNLAGVEVLWRVLLFLVLSYHLRSLWRSGSTERGATHGSGTV